MHIQIGKHNIYLCIMQTRGMGDQSMTHIGGRYSYRHIEDCKSKNCCNYIWYLQIFKITLLENVCNKS